MYGIEIPKQRGIYSEILTTEDTENLKVSTLRLKIVFSWLANRFLSIASINLRTQQGKPLLG